MPQIESIIEICEGSMPWWATIFKSACTEALLLELSIRGSDFACPMIDKKATWDTVGSRNVDLNWGVRRRTGGCQPTFLELCCLSGNLLILGGDSMWPQDTSQRLPEHCEAAEHQQCFRPS